MQPISKSRLWVEGARPKTIPAAVVPVLVGTVSIGTGFIFYRFLLALVVSIALQVGVNYANDYSDGIRGTDKDRVGPRRLVGSQLIQPEKVKLAAGLSFLLAAIAGLILAVAVSLWLIAIGCLAIIAAWFYTGGSKPYGYYGYGEISVFIFFGLIATVGSAFLQAERIEIASILCSIPVGFLATALLVTNNLRDIETDSKTGKQTLAVRLGKSGTQKLYIFLLFGALVINVLIACLYAYWALIVLLALPLTLKLTYDVYFKLESTNLIKVLENTAKLHLLSGLLLSIGLILSL